MGIRMIKGISEQVTSCRVKQYIPNSQSQFSTIRWRSPKFEPRSVSVKLSKTTGTARMGEHLCGACMRVDKSQSMLSL